MAIFLANAHFPTKIESGNFYFYYYISTEKASIMSGGGGTSADHEEGEVGDDQKQHYKIFEHINSQKLFSNCI